MPDQRPATTDSPPDVVERMTDAYLRLDDEFRVVAMNDRAERLHHCSREELVGTRVWDALDGGEAVQPFESRLRQVMEERDPVEFEAHYDPHDADYAIQAYPTDDGGLEVYYRDVSMRQHWKGALARYATVVEAVNDGVLVVDEDDEVEMVNGAVETLLDAHRGALIGTPVADLPSATTLTEADAAAVAEAVTAVRDGDADEEWVQLDVPGPDGAPGVAELRLVPLLGPPGSSVAGVVRDVTERHEHERVVRALHEATRELFRAEDPLDVCAAAVHTGADLLDLQISGIWLLDEERNLLEPVAATAGAHETVGGLPMFAEGEGLAWDAFREDEAMRFDDVRASEAVYNPDTAIRSELIVPIGSHGVLMAGDTEVGAFTETDLELAEVLAANTEVVLDRLNREQLLEDRAAKLRRQTQRLSSVEGVVSGPITAALDDLTAALEGDDAVGPESAAEARAAAERARRLVDVAETYADPQEAAGALTGVSLGESLRSATRAVDAPVPDVVVADDGTLRADADLLADLLGAVLRAGAERDASAVQLGLLRARESTARRYDGFYLEDDGGIIPERVRSPPFDPYAGDVAVGLEVERARLLARDHGWSFDATPAQRGMRFEVTEVTTLSPATE